jgi:hypothetical protein
MKKLSAGLIIISLFFSCSVAIAQSGLHATSGAVITVQNGAALYINGPMHLANTSTLNNAGIVTIARQGADTADFNDQSVTPYAYGTGKFIFTGPGVQNIRGGTFNELEMAKTANSKLNLLNDITVSQRVIFNSGLLDLNQHELTLAPLAFLFNESENSRITGVNGGYVTIDQASVNSPNAFNAGAVGAAITSSQNLGSLLISRTHKPAVNPANPLFTGIQRSYIITPQNNTALNATLRFNYFDAELNGKNENTLVLWRSIDGINWSNVGFDSRNTVDNYVTKNNIAAFSIWTLTDALNVLPIKLISFAAVCNNGVTTLKWKTGVEEPGSKFNIEKSYDGANFITIGTQAAIGSGSNSYQFIDNQPATNMGSNVFYRLKVIDAGALFSYSPVFSGNCNEATMPMQIYPNPAQHYTNIKISVRQKQEAQLLVYSVAGQLVFTGDYTLQTGTNNFTIPLINMASGTYAIKVTLSNGQKLNGTFIKN